MEIQVWASLLGVVLGGLLSYLAQFTTVRVAARNEEKRQAAQRAEARRSEQLEPLREFITITQESIRIAEERDQAPDWDAAGTPEWFAAARAPSTASGWPSDDRPGLVPSGDVPARPGLRDGG
ncbi:hypothetical protein [Nonomuraea sp. JJY05]|uniref:hypothetical protein n=1 Tax=Nonomuraea sp. JJY05 TaxID=3350255 RepID=UPI00373E7A15